MSGFSTAQQVIYRKLVKRAWSAYCASNHTSEKDKLARDRWYRATLHEAAGVYTTKDCNKKGDFERAMAGFEAVIGDSIYWQTRADEGPLRRARNALAKLMRQHDIEENYVGGIARQMFDTHHTNLNSERLEKVIIALKTDLGRHSEPAEAMANGGNPF